MEKLTQHRLDTKRVNHKKSPSSKVYYVGKVGWKEKLANRVRIGLDNISSKMQE